VKLLNLIRKRKLLFLNLYLTLVVLLLLPGFSYYEQVRASYQQPEVLSSHFLLPPLPLIAKNKTGNLPPNLSAKAVLITDVNSAQILLEKGKDERLLPASTTKIMTALVALDYYQKDQVITVPEWFRDGQNVKLQKGETMTFTNLLYCLLVASANDAAETLAANYPGGRVNFIIQMNQKAQELGLTDTHFANPSGIDEENHFSSARDMTIMAKTALKNPKFAEIVQTTYYVAYSTDQRFVHPMNNINTLLGRIPGVKGIKTGWTENAGECLVTLSDKNGRQIIIVVFGSLDRFGETEKLLKWVDNNFVWESAV
jgi:serine-type D-Ala-D-Ala carboxypeptidase (penicillin-binding protein 5/6)